MSQETLFTKTEKEKIIKEAINSGNQRATADKYGIPHSRFYGWVKSYKEKDNRALRKQTKSELQELEDLRLENQILKELLKKTTQTLIKD